MKISSTLIKALVLTGLIGASLEANAFPARKRVTLPPAPEVSGTVQLSSAQIASLGATDAAALEAAAASILSNAPAANRPELAKQIAKYVAQTKSAAVAAKVVKALVTARANESAGILLAALVGNPAIAESLKVEMPAQAANVAVLAATVTTSTTGNTTTAIVNPNTNSTN